MVSGTYTVDAAVLGVTPIAFTLTNLADIAARFTVAGFPSPTTAGQSQNFTVTALDQFDNIATSYTGTIGFTSDDTQAVLPGNSTLTAGTGTFTGELRTAGTRSIIATDTITASVTGSQTGIQVNPANPFAINAIAGTPQSTTVNTAFSNPLQVEVRDAFGNVIPNSTVTFNVPGTGASAGLSTTTITTDATGRGSVSATANTIAGTYNATGSVTGVAAPATFSLTNLAGTVTRFDVTGFPTPITAGTAGSFTISAFDAFNNLATNYAGTVSFSTSDPRGTLPGASTLTNGTRTFNGTLITAGTRSITATDSALAVSGSQTGIVVNPAAPNLIRSDAGNNQSTVVNTAFPTNLQATILDLYDNVVPNATVSFTVPGSGASGVFTGSATLATDANGRVTIPIRANTIAGQFNAQAQVNSLTTSFALTNNPDVPFSVDAIAGDRQSTTVNTAFANSIQVQVRDQFGNVIPNAVVNFNAPTSGASTQTTSAPVNTDTNGIAGLAIAANTIAGQYINNASVNGAPTSANFNLTNTPDRPASITPISGGGQRTVVNTAFNQALQVQVRDRFGNVIPNATVQFDSPTSGASSRLVRSTTTTNASGIAQTNVDANTIAGTFSTTGTVDNLNTAFSLTNLPDVPAQVIPANNNQRTPVQRAFSRPLQVTILDQFGNPVPDSAVTFTLPDQGASGRFANGLQTITANTNANGVVQVRVTANDIRGNFAGTATVTGVTPVLFNFSNLSGFTLAEEIQFNLDFFGRTAPINPASPIEQSPILCAVRDRVEAIDAYQGLPACVNQISKRRDP